MKRLMLAGLIVAGVQGRAAEVSRIELMPLETVTATASELAYAFEQATKRRVPPRRLPECVCVR